MTALANSLTYWLKKSAEQLTDSTLARFEQDHTFLQNLIRTSLKSSAYHAQAAQLLLTLQPLIERRGIADQWLPITHQVRQVLAKNQPLFWQVSAMCGYLHFLLRSFTESRALLEPIVTHNNAPRLTQADAAHYLSCLHYDDHQLELAETYAQQARNHYEQIGDQLPPRKLATCANQLGLIASKQQQKDVAATHFQSAVALWEAANDVTYQARTLNNWAEMYLFDTTTNQALQLLKRAEAQIATTDSEQDKARIQLNLGTYHIARHDWSTAKAYFDQAESHLHLSADLHLQALVHNNLGAALTELDQLQEAESRLQLAIYCWEQMNNQYMRGISLGGIAQIKARAGHIGQAGVLYTQALTILFQIPSNATVVQQVQRLKEEQSQLTS